MQILLGIGSRVSHTDYGDGVIINLKASGYTITFFAAWRKSNQLRYTSYGH